MPTDQKVPVIQADRDAAAKYLAANVGDSIPLASLAFDRIPNSKADDHSLVQAFARHRLQQPIGGTAREVLAAEYRVDQMPIAANAIALGHWDEAEQVAPALRAIQSVLDREAGLRVALEKAESYCFGLEALLARKRPTEIVAVFAALTPMPIEAEEVGTLGEVFERVKPFIDAAPKPIRDAELRHVSKPTPSATSDEKCRRCNGTRNARRLDGQLLGYCPDCPPVSASSEVTSGVVAIAVERLRQIASEGWTLEHDDQHGGDLALARAAACYALAGTGGNGPFWITHMQVPQQVWPYRWEWKPKDRRSNLVRAGALIAAEIDRLDRAAEIRKLKEASDVD